MRYCTSCGAGIGDDAKFCIRCGASQPAVLRENVHAQNETPMMEDAPPSSVQAQKPRTDETFLWTVGGILAVILALAAGLLIGKFM